MNKPTTFDQFWNSTLRELENLPIEYQTKHQQTIDEISCYSLTYPSLDKLPVNGYLLEHNGNAKRPVVIHTHGYNGQCDTMWSWAEKGLNVVGIDLRGFGRSREAITTHPEGWILTGLDNPKTSILRGAICDYLRAIDIARDYYKENTNRTIYYGFSLAGTMAMVAASLTNYAGFVSAGVPSLGWMEGRRSLVRAGSGQEVNRYIRHYSEKEDAIMKTLSFFDTAHFAERITAPTLVGIGKKDIIVPAETVWPIVQRLQCSHVVREFPYSHSNQPEEILWKEFEEEWLGLATNERISL